MRENKMRLLISDFDGVLCDSATEGFLSAYNTYRRLQSPDSERILDMRELPADHERRFRALRPYLHGAEDFIPILHALHTDAEISSQAEFDAFRAQFQQQLREYQLAFYAERDFLRRHEAELWLKLNPLYPEIHPHFSTLAPFENVHILTTKREEDVKDIFADWKIDFPASHINSVGTKEKYGTLLDILQKTKTASEEAVYIEDQVSFLPPAGSHGIQVYLAGWGYVSEEQRELADSRRIPVLDSKGFAEIAAELQVR